MSAVGPWAAAVLAAVTVGASILLGATRPATRVTGGPIDTGRAGSEGRRWGRVRTAQVLSEDGAVGDLAEGLAAQLRAGASLPEAIAGASARVEPLGTDLATMRRQLRRGESVDGALAAFAVDASAERALLVAALRMAARHGGRTADALDGVAGTVRDRTAVSAELAAQTSQARYSAWVLAALPPLFLILGSTVDPRLLGALASPGGVLALLVALGFELAGAAWIRRILAAGSRSIGHR